MRRVALALSCAFAATTAICSETDPSVALAGLLSPAQVADGPPGCVRAGTERPLALHRTADDRSPRVGSLVWRPWREASGECDAVQAMFEPASGGPARRVPTFESGYEVPALTVLERRGTWFRIDLGPASAWLAMPPEAGWEDYPALLTERLAYSTAAWDGRLCTTPDGECRRRAAGKGQALRVLRTGGTAGAEWMEVELTTGACTGDGPVTLARGWMRARDAGGAPTAWFHSRGC